MSLSRTTRYYDEATPAFTQRLPSQEIPKRTEETSAKGTLSLQAVTAGGAFPVPNAEVLIEQNRNGTVNAVAFDTTNRSGSTKVFSLDALPKSLSLSPSETVPFVDYTIKISHPLYYTLLIEDVQIFEDSLTLQTAELLPLPEFVKDSDIIKTIVLPKQNL